MAKRKIETSKNSLKLLKEILRDDGKPQDFAGNTRLTLLSDKIKLLPPDNMERLNYIWAINECAGNLEDLTVKEIINLCNLINLAKLRFFEYYEDFIEGFKRWEETSDNIEQRAEIFRLIGESGNTLSPDFLYNEQEIKKKYPWYWIDVAVNVDWDVALEVIKDWLIETKDFMPIIQRLPYWLDLHENKEKFYKILSGLLKSVSSDDTLEAVKFFLESIEVPAEKIAKIIGPDEKINIDFIQETIKKRSSYNLMYA